MGEQVSLELFEEEALEFLHVNAELRVEEKRAWGEGSDRASLFAEKTPEEQLAEIDVAKAWRQKVFDAGFGWITGPDRYGGRALPGLRDRPRLVQRRAAPACPPQRGQAPPGVAS